MYFIKRLLEPKTLNAIIRLYSLAKKSHYDVLKLRKNCTEKEIKDAFIKMSKEYHPDKNKDRAAQEKFVQIVEAYTVLSKPGSRAQYDNMARTPSSTYEYKPSPSYNARRNPYQNNYNYQYHYQSTTKKTQNTAKNSSFYGMTGTLPNYVIILTCLGLALAGCILQMYLISKIYNQQQQQALEKSKLLGEELAKVKAAAHGNGNDLQTRLLMEKIVMASNPTAATASLGQALASEKKDTDTLLTEFGISDMLVTDYRCYMNRNTMEGNRTHCTFKSLQ